MAEEVKVGSRVVEITDPDKVLFPDDGITKHGLVDYYLHVAETMLPYLAGRPLSMQRFPNGIDGEGFYQKEVPAYFPAWIERVQVTVEGEGRAQPQVVCGDAATLAYLANQACITPHVWLSRADSLHNPDRLIFDLDPPGDDFEAARAAARALRGVLDEVGLTAWVMTTGSRGLHLWVPLDRSADYDAVHAFARDLAGVLAEREPQRLTVEVRKNQRKGRLFLDYLRNSYAQTSVAPYAVRAKAGAPVATPLDWDELDDGALHSQTYTMVNLFRRLGQRDDPWKGIMRHARSLEEPRRRLDALMAAG